MTSVKVVLTITLLLLVFNETSYTQDDNRDNAGNIQQEKVVKPVGVFAEIDVERSNAALAVLVGDDEKEIQRVVAEVLAEPGSYNPTVLSALSGALYHSERRDEAPFWFYAGQLRARADANVCADVSARQGVSILNDKFGKPVNRYMFHRLDKLTELIPKVVEWDRETPREYDHRWLNLHGMDAMLHSKGSGKGKEPELSKPEDQWEKDRSVRSPGACRIHANFDRTEIGIGKRNAVHANSAIPLASLRGLRSRNLSPRTNEDVPLTVFWRLPCSRLAGLNNQ